MLISRPGAALLPRVAAPPVGAALRWRRLWIPLSIAMFATPLLLRVLPTHFLPVLVGDYLAVHFAVYGLIIAACLLVMHRAGAGAALSRKGLRFGSPATQRSFTTPSGTAL